MVSVRVSSIEAPEFGSGMTTALGRVGRRSVRVVVDARCALAIAEALEDGQAVDVAAEPWQLLEPLNT
jgi:hypothetical protein